MSGLLIPQSDGSTFVAHERHVPEVPPFGHLGDDEGALRSWVSAKWNMLFELKRGENARLKLNELFYAGFHYEDPLENKARAITNYCHSTVETIWPILTEARPRPEPVPRRSMDAMRIKRVAGYAQYKMDTSAFDKTYRLCVRDLLKHGWCCPMIGWDARGNSISKYLSPFDFYPDGATDESEMECFAIARPVSVRRLRALFPKVADKIQPDNMASPSYEALVRPYLDYYLPSGSIGQVNVMGPMNMGASIAIEGTPATTTSAYVADTGSFMVFGDTAFLVQLFVRDYTTMTVRYVGDRTVQHATGELVVPHSEDRQEPCCPSGWRMVPMLANGTLLAPPMPVDEALDGIPLVIGRNYEQGGRFYAKGELDDVIPLQRGINRSDALLDMALERVANPAVKVSRDAGLAVDKSTVEGGELLRIARGAMLEYMAPPSVPESHFERRAVKRTDIQIIAGTPDALAGQRPVGIEAASAIRNLQQGASTRARAKAGSMLEWAALLLKKMIRADAMKSEDAIYFRGADGAEAWVSPQDLRPDDFDIRWASQSGTAQGEQDRADENKQLFQLGIIDAQAVLDDEDYPDRQNILQRVGLQRMQAAAAAAQAAPGKNGGGKP